ncbi:MAG: hypothetical protein Q7K40_02780 [bacterium]|nr:hypothetical protein [bacterium]
MFIIITLFYLSLATIIAMVSWKLVTIRGVNLSPLEGVEKELHGKLHETIHRGWYVLKAQVLVRVSKLVLSGFYTGAHAVLHFTELVGQKLKARHGKWFDMVKGKGVNSKKGSASFFLKDVAEYKKSIQGK